MLLGRARMILLIEYTVFRIYLRVLPLRLCNRLVSMFIGRAWMILRYYVDLFSEEPRLDLHL